METRDARRTKNMSTRQSQRYRGQSAVRSQGSGSQLDYRLVVGIAVIVFGAALFALGMFHGFANGSCSTTGYDRNFGPVPTCGKGIGWWMLILLVGIVVIGAGAALSGTSSSIAGAVLFIAIGVASIATAVNAGNNHLLLGGSASTGKIFAGVFGACFLIGGLIWGIAGRGALARAGGGTLFASLLASGLGVAVALVIATGISGAVGSSAATVPGRSAGETPAEAAASRQATAQTNRAAKQAAAATRAATAQAGIAEKLAACVTSAGSNIHRIQRCEAKYVP
jgi:hypothetical protein